MEMTKVGQCEVDDCSYNWEQRCHAFAITIGDDVHPLCDTFCRSSAKGGDEASIAGVGACKVATCSHNNSLECGCSEISVGFQGDEIDCMNFETR